MTTFCSTTTPLDESSARTVWAPGTLEFHVALTDRDSLTPTVKFTEDSILLQRVRKAPSWELEADWQRFDRAHEHRFVLMQHDKAQAEKDDIDYQIRNKPGLRVARYYGESWYVVLEYLGQRFDIAEVMGQRRANAILDRLAFCDKYMDSLVDVRKGLSIRPQDDWSGPSGSVPQ